MKITICGDFVPIARGIGAVKDRTALGADVLEVLKGSDYSIVNLEAPVASNIETRIPKNGPHLNTDSDTLSYLRECGVSVVTLANNHFLDYGIEGVEHTISSCIENGILYVGGGRDLEERSKILYLEKGDEKIAILNYCESEFSVQSLFGSNPINPIQVFYDIKKAKKNGGRIIIITHGGHEGYNLPSPRMKQLYRYFIDLGADVVCNHHQHCYSGFEVYNDGYIFYGLGNFYFDDHRAKRNRSLIWNYGYVVNIDIGPSKICCYAVPYEQCMKNPVTTFLVGQDMVNFDKQIKYLNNIISNDTELCNSFDHWCHLHVRLMRSWFTPYSSRILMALYRKGLLPSFLTSQKKIQLYNAIRCESHRDIALSALKQYEKPFD